MAGQTLAIDCMERLFLGTCRAEQPLLPPFWLAGAGARRERNNNKHKRLFIGGEGALQDGQKLFYKTGNDGALLRSGFAVINPDGVSGIKCDCCNQVGTNSGVLGRVLKAKHS